MNYLSNLEFLARAGGGGSDGGGGGIGGAAAVGWLIAHFTLTFLRKIIAREILLPISAAITGAASLALFIFATISGNGIFIWLAIEFIVGLWIGWSSAMFNFWDKMKRRFKKADEALQQAGWDENELHRVASEIFMRYQADWSRRDGSQFIEYMSPYYATHAHLMLRALAEMKRINTMSDVAIVRMDTSNVTDNPDDDRDYFSVFIEAKARDRLIQEIDGKELFVDTKNFIEEWTFQKISGEWRLAGIRQTTENATQAEATMQQFAVKNKMYYSLDMGWLFIPARGQLFNNGKWSFGYSDINNHVIGTYHDMLVQLYTYRRNENRQKNAAKNFLVGQVNVPKEYGGIIIERKKGMFGRIFAPKGYQKYEFEWPDFNKRYNVYATDQSRLASFELLNPGFMAFLYDNFNDVNVEVVDNFIYFYSETSASVDALYQKHLTLLEKSFKELKL